VQTRLCREFAASFRANHEFRSTRQLSREAGEWVNSCGKLVKHDGFRQLFSIKYKVSTDKVLQIEPKEDLKKRSGKSPDYAGASMLTLTPRPLAPNIRIL
jgi:hypothetical protein